MTRQPFWGEDVAGRLREVQEELGRLLLRARGAAMGAEDPTAPPTDLDPSSWEPVVDLVEAAGEVRVWVDLPGVDAAAIDLTVAGTVLTLRGQRPPAEGLGDGRAHVLERPVGPFVRQVPLPCEVDVEKVEAHARDGVLQIRLPKAEAARPRTIPIRPA